jgi:hypothetical protein
MGGDIVRRKYRLVNPQLLVPLEPELGRGMEFEIVGRRTSELLGEFVERCGGGRSSCSCMSGPSLSFWRGK